MRQAGTVLEPSGAGNAASRHAAIDHSESGSQQTAYGMTLGAALVWSGAAIACFHLAYGVRALCFLVVGYVFALAQLTRVRTTRMAAWLGFGVGFLTAAPQLTCFWTLFGPGAIALWSVLGFWIGLFVVVGRFAVKR